MHTNYLDYARREEGGETKAKLLEAYNNWVCRVHCHKVRRNSVRTRRRFFLNILFAGVCATSVQVLGVYTCSHACSAASFCEP